MRVLPLDESWHAAIGGVLRARGWPALDELGKLGPLVRRLSDAYNATGTAAPDLLPARLAFSFARDVPKSAGAVRELVALGLLTIPEGRPLRVLDLGAGLGASTWGVARALESAGGAGDIEALWVDGDAAALSVGLDLLRARGEASAVRVRAQTAAGGVSSRAVLAGGAHDLVLLGQVLSELDSGAPEASRVATHASMITRLLAESVRPDGALVVIEPALRDRTRHLHAVRDALLASKDVTLFAPCLHRGGCPALASEGDWCHEDLDVDLPAWLVPLARAAGLRWQGLTWSYLVLRKDGRSLQSRGFPWRVVSGSLVTKGKCELFLCGAPPSSTGADVPVRARVQRIDRHETPENEIWRGLARGDRVRFRPPIAVIDRRSKVLETTAIDVDPSSE